MSTSNKNKSNTVPVIQISGKKNIQNFLKQHNMTTVPSKKKEEKSKQKNKPKKVQLATSNPRPQSAPLLASKKKHHVAKITGKGDYSIKDAYNNVFDKDTESEGFVNKAAKKVGEAVGGTFGFGRELGNAASRLAKIFGFGDYSIDDQRVINHKYKIKKNSFMANSPPTFSNGAGEDIIITRREYVKDIAATQNFSAQKFFLNPGNPELFPWLSQFARGYEEYQFLGMVFEFKSTASAAAADGGGIATVIMATDYDCLDENYDDKRTMENSEFSNSVKASYSTLHPIECDPKRNVLGKMYVLPGITNVNQVNAGGAAPFSDPRFDTLGQFYVGVQGAETGTEGSQLGELWVSYKVKLSRPILEIGAAAQNSIQSIQATINTSGAPQTFTNGSNVWVKSIGSTMWSFIEYMNIGNTASLGMRLRYNGTGSGYFMFHICSRIHSSLSSTWVPNTLDNTNLSSLNWVLDSQILRNSNTGTTGTFYAVTNLGNTASVASAYYRTYDIIHIGSFAPNPVVGSTYRDILVPMPVNTMSDCQFSCTIIGLPNYENIGSRIRQLINKNLAINQANDNIETSDYMEFALRKQNKENVSYSKAEVVDSDQSDDEEDSNGTTTPFEKVETGDMKPIKGGKVSRHHDPKHR